MSCVLRLSADLSECLWLCGQDLYLSVLAEFTIRRCALGTPGIRTEFLVQDLLDSFMGVDGRYITARLPTRSNDSANYGSSTAVLTAGTPHRGAPPLPVTSTASLWHSRDLESVSFVVNPSGTAVNAEAAMASESDLGTDTVTVALAFVVPVIKCRCECGLQCSSC